MLMLFHPYNKKTNRQKRAEEEKKGQGNVENVPQVFGPDRSFYPLGVLLHQQRLPNRFPHIQHFLPVVLQPRTQARPAAFCFERYGLFCWVLQIISRDLMEPVSGRKG